MPKSKGWRGKLIENARITSGIIIGGVALGLHAKIVQIHVIPADNAGEKFIIGDMLIHRG